MRLAEEVRDVIVTALRARYGDKIDLRHWVPQAQEEEIILARLQAEHVDNTLGELTFAVRIDPEWLDLAADLEWDELDKLQGLSELTSPSRELLESLTNWLETRSHMPLAVKGGQGKLMREYAAEMRKFIPTAPPAPKPSMESLFEGRKQP